MRSLRDAKEACNGLSSWKFVVVQVRDVLILDPKGNSLFCTVASFSSQMELESASLSLGPFWFPSSYSDF